MKQKLEEPARKRPRKDLLDEVATQAGQLWASLVRDELRVEGRRAAGGWPGTVAEARARAATSIGVLLREQAMVALTHAELARAAEVVYGAARRAWLLVPAGKRTAEDIEDDLT